MLDNLKKISKLDTNLVALSIEKLPSQIEQVLSEINLIKLPREYNKVNQVVVNGMGGSNVGAGIVKSVLAEEIKVPISITPGYRVPAHINKNTLYIISSYSGDTEEPLSVFKEVKKRRAKLAAITSRGKGRLERLMVKNHIPGYIFKPEFNPSNRTNYGLGYSIFSFIALLAKAKLFRINYGEIKKIIQDLENRNKKLKPESRTQNNPAKQLAKKLVGRQVIAVAAEFLNGNLRVLRNQICENGKNFASLLSLPELNHYAMEGLSHPTGNRNNLIFLFFDSEFYHPRIKKRSQLTKEVVRRNKIKIVEYQLTGKTKLEQTFEMLQLGSWISYYLAILNNSDPSKKDWVDYFKRKLTQL